MKNLIIIILLSIMLLILLTSCEEKTQMSPAENNYTSVESTSTIDEPTGVLDRIEKAIRESLAKNKS